METFTEMPVTDQIYIISGLRGTGKTVLFSSLIKDFRQMDDWIVIQLKTYDDMPEYDRMLASASYSKMWTEMSALDKKVCRAIAATDGGKVKDIRNTVSLSCYSFQ